MCSCCASAALDAKAVLGVVGEAIRGWKVGGGYCEYMSVSYPDAFAFCSSGLPRKPSFDIPYPVRPSLIFFP